MKEINDLVKILDDVKVALVAITSTVTFAIICIHIIGEKFKRKK